MGMSQTNPDSPFTWNPRCINETPLQVSNEFQTRKNLGILATMFLAGPSRGVRWRSLSSVGASIGDPFEGAGRVLEASDGSLESLATMF